MADDALTDAEWAWVSLYADGAPEKGLKAVRAYLDGRIEERIAQARAEGARDALNAAADEIDRLGFFIGPWLRERAAQHEEQP